MVKRLFRALLAATVMLSWPFSAAACPAELIGPCSPIPKMTDEAAAPLPRGGSTNGEHTVLEEVRAAGNVVIDDATYLLTSPLRMDKKSALIAGAIAAGIGGLMVVDEDIQRAFQENRTETGDEIAKTLNSLGDAQIVFAANAALVGAGWLFREREDGNKLMRTALVSLESQFFVEGITGLTKFAVGRQRPDEEVGSHTYLPFDHFDTSFPSSHAARAFALAAVFAEAYPQPIPVLAYTGAALISLSRIYQNEHFASDVFAGAALGFFIGKALSWRHNQPDLRRSWNVLPFVPEARGGFGLTVQIRF
jgi:membrane-associated phospholipid phosphatase